MEKGSDFVGGKGGSVKLVTSIGKVDAQVTCFCFVCWGGFGGQWTVSSGDGDVRGGTS